MGGPFRGSSLDFGRRAYFAITRGVLQKSDDNKLWQENNIDLMFNDGKEGVERAQNYGFTSVPLKPDEKQKSTKSPESEGSSENKQKGAEVIVAFLNGNRSHAVVLSVDDRRHRLKNMKEGESAQYDDQGQRIHIKRDAVVISTPKKIVNEVVKDEKRSATDYGQDASKSRTAKTRITHDDESITFEILDDGGSVKTSVKLNKDGVALKGENIVNTAEKKFVATAPQLIASGDPTGWGDF